MRYQIEKRHDIELGALLTVRFPEELVDKKALYTIQNDMPVFLMPFTCRTVGGMLECTYRVGNLLKLEYRFGTRTEEEYVQCWNLVLQPLIECKDWFLNPFCFVMQSSELYTDREETCVKYLYVPVKESVESYDSLKAMVLDISRQNRVNNAAVENMVLRALMEEFSPKSFLQMLSSNVNTAKSQPVRTASVPSMPVMNPVPKVHAPVTQTPVAQNPVARPEPNAMAQSQISKVAEDRTPAFSADGDIMINFANNVETGKEKKEKKKGGLFGRGKKQKEEASMMYGAPAESMNMNANTNTHMNSVPMMPFDDDILIDDSVTQIEVPHIGGTPTLVYVGNNPTMPKRIAVSMSEYGRFTIGRFDSSIGTKQSDFEFEKTTRGVSRRHAIIEKRNGCYTITDLQSSAGTFVNGKKLDSNEVCILEKDARISFGFDGADYMWTM